MKKEVRLKVRLALVHCHSCSGTSTRLVERLHVSTDTLSELEDRLYREGLWEHATLGDCSPADFDISYCVTCGVVMRPDGLAVAVPLFRTRRREPLERSSVWCGITNRRWASALELPPAQFAVALSLMRVTARLAHTERRIDVEDGLQRADDVSRPLGHETSKCREIASLALGVCSACHPAGDGFAVHEIVTVEGALGEGLRLKSISNIRSALSRRYGPVIEPQKRLHELCGPVETPADLADYEEASRAGTAYPDITYCVQCDSVSARSSANVDGEVSQLTETQTAILKLIANHCYGKKKTSPSSKLHS